MRELTVFIDSNSKIPVYEQIYAYIKKEITNGNLVTGEVLPSSRALAESLQVSRSTVLMAYDQLLAEGYIETKPQKGCYVMEIEKGFGDNIQQEEKVSKSGEEKSFLIDFSPVGIETNNFPYNEWRKISKQIYTSENADLFDKGDVRGDFALRKNISEYLRKSRGVNANPEMIVITAGHESALMMLNFLLDKGEFAMENPAYPKVYKSLEMYGRKVIPINLDEYGIDMEQLEKSDIDIVYVTPSHQYPTGIVMSVGRRHELLQWAIKDSSRYIIEDDYDSEFRYRGKPIPALQGIDTSEKVIYIGTFSKSISPGLRMSYMVLPHILMTKFMEKFSFGSNTVSATDQRMVAMFMESGGFERHLSRMRNIYKNKHSAMLSELKTWNNVEIMGENAGAHMLLKVLNGMTERELIRKAGESDIKVYALSDCYIDADKREAEDSVVILGYAKLDETAIIKGLGILKQQWRLE